MNSRELWEKPLVCGSHDAMHISQEEIYNKKKREAQAASQKQKQKETRVRVKTVRPSSQNKNYMSGKLAYHVRVYSTCVLLWQRWHEARK